MGSKTLHSKRNDTTRRILKAAADIFSEVGFAGARVDEIADRARVNKATIYYHIGDKKALYGNVLHDVFSHTVERIARNIKESESSEEKLKSFIYNFADTLDRHPHLPAIMLREIASGGQHFPELVIRDLTQIFGILRDILQEGVDRGVFIQTTPFVVHMMVVGATVFYKASGPIRTRHALFPDTVKQLDRNISGNIADEIVMLVLKAIKK